MKSPLAFVGFWRVLDNRPFRSAPVPQFLGQPHPWAANPGALPGLNERREELDPALWLVPEYFRLSDPPPPPPIPTPPNPAASLIKPERCFGGREGA